MSNRTEHDETDRTGCRGRDALSNEPAQLPARQSRAASSTSCTALASPVRDRILQLLRRHGPLNVNQISEALELPQSTIATNIQVLEESELDPHRDRQGTQRPAEDLRGPVRRDHHRARCRGDQPREERHRGRDAARPLHAASSVSAPAGCARPKAIIGVLDVPDLFLDPARVKAALIWFGRGYRRIQVSPTTPRCSRPRSRRSSSLLELSSEVPGTNANWPSDISFWVNDVKIGTWTSPGDFGDRRGVLHAALVEARRVAIRRADELAHLDRRAPSRAKKCRP